MSKLLLLISIILVAISPVFTAFSIIGTPYSAWAQDESIRQIVFVSDRDGNREIYIMDADGSNMQNLTRNTADDAYPVWSPLAQQIAFVSDRDFTEEDRGIYVMNIDGSNPYNLFEHVEDQIIDSTFPMWSPNGTQIAFTRSIRGIRQDGTVYLGDANIYVATLDGSTIVSLSLADNLTNEPHWHVVSGPIWSPDGQYIAFFVESSGGPTWRVSKADDKPCQGGWEEKGSFCETQVGIYVASPDGKEIQLVAGQYEIDHTGISGRYDLYFRPRYDGSFSFSSDSQYLLFAGNFQAGIGTYKVNVEYPETQYLLLENIYPSDAIWAPDGTSIAYTDPETGYLWLMDVDGTNKRQLNDIASTNPNWSPDSRQITFASSGDIFIINADGSDMRNLTNSDSEDAQPSWVYTQ